MTAMFNPGTKYDCYVQSWDQVYMTAMFCPRTKYDCNVVLEPSMTAMFCPGTTYDCNVLSWQQYSILGLQITAMYILGLYVHGSNILSLSSNI